MPIKNVRNLVADLMHSLFVSIIFHEGHKVEGNLVTLCFGNIAGVKAVVPVCVHQLLAQCNLTIRFFVLYLYTGIGLPNGSSGCRFPVFLSLVLHHIS